MPLYRIFVAMFLCICLGACQWIFTTVTEYKDVSFNDIYREGKSKKNYFAVQTVVMSHCGCTDAWEIAAFRATHNPALPEYKLCERLIKGFKRAQ
jgi:hypothetical protein